MYSVRRLVAASAAAALVTAAAAAAGVIAAAPATAAPTSCGLLDWNIYNPPAESRIGAPGSLIACSSTALPHVPGNVPKKAWKVQYSSLDAKNRKIAVSGLVAPAG